MTPIEERLRVSLSERAADVEPTPHLWQEVDRRITRRRWLRASAYAVVGATAALAAVLVLPGVVSDLTGPATPEILGEDDAPGTDDGPVGDDAGTDDPATDDGATGVDPGTGEGSLPLIVADGRELVLVAADGARTTLTTLTAEGESTFRTVSVRPGSTVEDLQLVASTSAEGMVDLRYLHVVDGEVVTQSVLDGGHAPATDAGSPEHGLAVVWSPDGDSLAWFEPSDTAGAVSLRTVGFSEDGPGTGDRATDNASFVLPLDGADGPVDAAAWVDRDPADDGIEPVPGAVATTMIVGVARDGSPAVLTAVLDRQADGAWARSAEDPGLLSRTFADAGADADQRVVAATAAGGELRALVLRDGAAALVTGDALAGAATATDLPGELADALARTDATAGFELIAMGSATLIVDAVEGSAWHVSAGGQVEEVTLGGAVGPVR